MKTDKISPFVSTGSLTNKFLVSVPNMTDDFFENTVIYICSNSEKDGSLGLVINKKAPIQFKDVLSQLSLTAAKDDNRPVLLGGPVDPVRGFILHSNDFKGSDTTPLTNDISLTVSVDVLAKIATGQNAPEKALVFLGYSSWAAGQLELEIAGNSWLVMDSTADFLFDASIESKWKKALTLMGVDPVMFSLDQGSV